MRNVIQKSKRRYLPHREQTEIVIDLQDVVDHGSDDLAEAIESNAERYVSRHTMRIAMDARIFGTSIGLTLSQCVFVPLNRRNCFRT